MNTGCLAVGICTFRRPGLSLTLESVERQEVPAGRTLTILVADNDETPSARAAVESFADKSRHAVAYIHAPARNISIARNAILGAARERGAARLAFIDDDEVAPEDWLSALCTSMAETGADAVVGPVFARYRADAPRWMRDARLHDTRPETDEEGRPIAGHTCNVLIDLTAPAFAGLRFDPARGRSGGEDTAFFEAARRAGARFALAPDAAVHEEVPEARARMDWLLRRRYRMGQTHGSLLAGNGSRLVRMRQAAIAAAKVGYCACAAAVTAPSASARNGNVLRGALHLGTLSALLGRGAISIYGSEDGAADRAATSGTEQDR